MLEGGIRTEDIKKLRGEITLEKVKKQVEDGWTNPFIIAEHIVGIDIWRCLPDWDKKYLCTMSIR